MKRDGERRWVALEVEAPPEAEDAVVAALAACGTAGSWSERPGLVRGYFAAPAPDLEQRFAAAWRALGQPSCRVAARPVPSEDWLAGWRESVRATLAAPGLWVAPPAAPSPATGTVVWIEPGEGFGTGSHATTRALLRHIAREPGRGPVLDVGTGSGVLALAALALGARFAVGLDPDTAALANAACNRALNDAPPLALVQGTLDALRPAKTFLLVLANLDAPTFERETGSLAERVAPGGRLGVAGILAGEEAPILARLKDAGLDLLDAEVDPDPTGDGAWWSGWLGR